MRPTTVESLHPILEATTGIDQLLKSVRDVNPIFMTTSDKATAMVELIRLESRVAELRLRVMAGADDVAVTDGARDVAAWLAGKARLRRGDVAADLRLARGLDGRLPRLAAALGDGRATLAHARVVARALAEMPDEIDAGTAARAEEFLVDQVDNFDPVDLARLGRRVLDVVAPEVAESAEAKKLAEMDRDASRRACLRLHALGDGTTRISGLIPDATAARLSTYLHAFTNPRIPRTDQSPPRAPFPRRAAEAFTQLLESLDPTRLPVHGGDATTVVVTVTLASLRSDLAAAAVETPLPGDSIGTISAAQARRLACTAKIIPAVLGSGHEVLDLGRSSRLFSRAQRRALLIRDRTCRAEHCDVPGSWTEAHHLDPWSRGGVTDLDNALLLCSHHHHRIHDPEYRTHRLATGDIRFRREQ